MASPVDPADPAVPPAAEPYEAETRTIDDLVALLGESSEAEVLTYVEGISADDLIKEGRTVATPRISKDVPKLFGASYDFLRTASEDQLDALGGHSMDLLRVGVWAAKQDESLWDRLRSGGGEVAGQKSEQVATADALRQRVAGKREVLYVALGTWAGEDPSWHARIDAAYGTMKEPKALVEAATKLIGVAKQMLRATAPGVVARRRGGRINEAWLEKYTAETASYKAAAEAAAAPVATPEVTQRQVDYWDGICLLLIGRVLDLHEAGNRLDASVPQLLPVSLRTHFRRKARAATPPPSTPQPTTTVEESDQ